MFYRPEAGHGLPHNPFNAIVAPRPIGWISTRGSDGDNLAPYSFFNAVAYLPPQVMFAWFRPSRTGRGPRIRWPISPKPGSFASISPRMR